MRLILTIARINVKQGVNEFRTPSSSLVIRFARTHFILIDSFDVVPSSACCFSIPSLLVYLPNERLFSILAKWMLASPHEKRVDQNAFRVDDAVKCDTDCANTLYFDFSFLLFSTKTLLHLLRPFVGANECDCDCRNWNKTNENEVERDVLFSRARENHFWNETMHGAMVTILNCSNFVICSTLE